MPESAAATDRNFLLRGIDHTPYRFSVRADVTLPTIGQDALIARYFYDHPDGTIKELADAVAELGGLPYNDLRALVVGLLDCSVLEISGRAPLEAVDGRYERVAACAVCGAPSSAARTLFYKYNTPVVQCPCGLLYANPRWKAEHLFGRYTEEYWDQYEARIAPTAASVAANQARWDPYISEVEPARLTGRLLDVGCATGEFLDAAAARGWQTYGLETSRIAAQIAAAKHAGRVHNGTLETAPWTAGYFDAITLWDVIEHLQDPGGYVEQIARLLRPGGMFAITTPNIHSVSYRLLGRDWSVVGPNDHIYFFAPRTLARLLTERGFVLHSVRTLATQPDTWQRWLHNQTLQQAIPLLERLTRPVEDRLMLGDAIFMVARLGGGQ